MDILFDVIIVGGGPAGLTAALYLARYKNTVTGEVAEYKSKETFGVFVFAGYAPATETVKGIVELNEQGYIVTDASRKTGLRADVPVPPKSITVTQKTAESGELFTAPMRQQLDALFSRMERPLLMKLYLDNRLVSSELEKFITALAALTDKLALEISDTGDEEAPCVEVCQADSRPTGLAFHGVPSGHEFTSFMLGLYNAAGPEQAIDAETGQAIAAITKPVEIKLLVTLSCTMCPDLVVAAQRIAAANGHVTAHVYDIRHFEHLKNEYQVMSVPCMVVNGKDVHFGKKTIQQVLDLIK